ncbi:hypothetical protein Tco_0731924, partial [Tanacetum coccineum]
MLNSQSWSDNKSKLLYVEILLGEQEKLMWQQWKTAYPEVYEILIGMADDPQNITSHMRTVIMMEDPYRGSTERQDIAQRDLDRLTWFNYNIENVVDHLSTRGISAIPGERRTMEGQSWHLRPFENETVKTPTGVAVHQRINRTTSLRFERYRSQTPSRASVDQRDQEVMGDDEETLLVAVAFAEEKPHQEGEECICEECLHNRRHITYDVCFCKDCLKEDDDLKYEPLNAQKRSNKPKNKKKQKWSTLGEPSGKWDYYVRYDITHPTIPIDEIAATGWGEEFEEEDQTLTTKFVVREHDTTDSSESEWENPFAVKSDGDQENENNKESCFL